MSKQLAPYDPRQPWSVYKRGADDGALLGIYLAVMMICMCASAYVPLAGYASLVMMLCVPFLIYRMLRRAWEADNRRSAFSVLWMHGVVAFVCATLIMGAAMWLYIRVFEPNLIMNMTIRAAEFYDTVGTPAAHSMSRVLHNMIEMHIVPTTAEVVVELILMGIFTGSILTIFMASLVRLFNKAPQLPPAEEE